MSDWKKKRYEAKASKLIFARQKLEYHNKVHLLAMEEFSSSFTKFIKSLDESKEKLRLQRMMGLVPPEEIAAEEEPEDPNISKAGKAAKERGKNKNKNKPEDKQEEARQEEVPPQEVQHRPKESLPEEYKQLYRKVALKAHPDRLAHLSEEERNEKNKILIEVNDAVKEKEYWKIVESAMLLDIEVPEELRFDTATLNKKIAEYNEEVKKIKKSVAWEWYNIEKDHLRDDLIKRYATFLLQNFK